MRARLTFALLVLGDAVALGGLTPSTDLLGRLAHPTHWVQAAGADRVIGEVAAAAIWVLALWVALGLGAVTASALPGATGRLATRIAAHTLPGGLRRLVAGSIGLGVLLAPVAAGAGSPNSSGTAVTATGSSAPRWVGSVPTPAWPSSDAPAPPTRTDRPLPGPHWPGDGGKHGRTHSPHSTEPPHRTDTRRSSAAPRARDVTVSAGDSLWLLAAHRLGPDADAHDIAAYWPRVYAANRDTVGSDPALITPGQVLHVPAPSPEGST